jgi:hypothetical protein
MDRDRREVAEALTVLGIPADSDWAQVARAYRRLARATHPDVSSDPDAAQRFATVTAAYRVLSGTTGPGARPARPAGASGAPQTGRTPPSSGSSESPESPPLGPPPSRSTQSDRTGVAGDKPNPSPDLIRSGPLFAVSPPLRAGFEDRPPIVAGPVLVRRTSRGRGMGEE